MCVCVCIYMGIIPNTNTGNLVSRMNLVKYFN